MKSVFLSYRRADSTDASRMIFDAISKRLGGIHVFRDVDSIPIGTDFVTVIDQEIDRSDAMVVIIGPKWLRGTESDCQTRLDRDDDFVRLEIERAIAKQIPIMAALVDGASMPRLGDLPTSMRPLSKAPRYAIDVSDDIASSINRLVIDIERAPRPIRRMGPIERYHSAARYGRIFSVVSGASSAVLGTVISAIDHCIPQWDAVRWTFFGLMILLVSFGAWSGWRLLRWLGLVIGSLLFPLVAAGAPIAMAFAVALPFSTVLGSLNTSIEMLQMAALVSGVAIGEIVGAAYLSRVTRIRLGRIRVAAALPKVVILAIIGAAISAAGVGAVLWILCNRFNLSQRILSGASYVLGVATLGALMVSASWLLGFVLGWTTDRHSREDRRLNADAS